MKKVIVVGAGLAGAEAAWQAAKRSAHVILYEMRPTRSDGAHKTAGFAELVCSNSLRGASLGNAVGVLKEEMRRMGSLILQAADATKVPAGGALAVDRTRFSDFVTGKIEAHPNIEVRREELHEIPREADVVTIVATGPLTDGDMAKEIETLTGGDSLYFYDAAAPIISEDSIDMDICYRASRYGKGEAAYLNCPMSKEEYDAFYDALISAKKTPTHTFEKEVFFEGCMPVEVMASRGRDTLLYGPMKPVGLEDPKTGKRPYAVVQLRQDNAAATLYNIVGFQTHLLWPEQKRVFSMIPGLQHANFLRYGVMHRNTFFNAPKHMLPTYAFKSERDLFFAGQMTGVEGYVESASSGLMAGINAYRLASGKEPLIFPKETCHGALAHYITTSEAKHFQPMNINFGLLPTIRAHDENGHYIRDKKIKKQMAAKRALSVLMRFIPSLEL